MPSEKAKKTYREKNREKLREASRQYYLANKEKHREATRRWKENNKEYCREQHRVQEARRQEKRKVELAGRPRPTICEVCNRSGVIRWDHDHETGKFRGWLCARCNNTLGHCQDNPEILKALIIYLDNSRGGE